MVMEGGEGRGEWLAVGVSWCNSIYAITPIILLYLSYRIINIFGIMIIMNIR